MPRILEMKRVDGELWVKLQPSDFDDGGPISVLNTSEIKNIRLNAYHEAINAITEMSETYG